MFDCMRRLCLLRHYTRKHRAHHLRAIPGNVFKVRGTEVFARLGFDATKSGANAPAETLDLMNLLVGFFLVDQQRINPARR
jgi:hypothetical protein